MTIEDLSKIINEYAKEVAPNDKYDQTAIIADSFGVLDKILEKCYLVEKSVITDGYNYLVNRLEEIKKLGSTVNDRIYNEGELNGKIDLLESLFPEIAKEVKR